MSGEQRDPLPSSAARGGPDVSVLIVGYNAADWLRRCLESLFGAGAPSRAFEVVLVDNDSSPPLAGQLGDHADRVRVVTLAQNVGFAAGVNTAAAAATGDRLLLLNPDTEVLPGSIDALCDFLDEDPARGIVGGRTITPDGGVDPRSCWAAPTMWSQFCFAVGLTTLRPRSPRYNPEAMPGWARDSAREVDVVTGCLLLVRRGLWAELGGFDSRFFMYGEDVDLCVRARGTGARPAITPRAVVVHAGGASSTTSAKTQMVLRGKSTLYRSHGTALTRPLSRMFLRTGIALRAVLERLHGGGSERVWAAAWRTRRDWAQGWTSRHQVPVVISTDSGGAA